MLRAFCLLLTIIVSLLAGEALAQTSTKGWLGIDTRDVSSEEAKRLNWEAPRGAKITAVRPGSPGEKAGLKAGDVILSVDGAESDTAADTMAAIESRRPGTEVRLRVHTGTVEKRLTAVLAVAPTVQIASSQDVPILQLDTGGHMAVIRAITFTPDGKYMVTTGDDKLIRVWDWRTGQTVRTIRGQSGVGHEGKHFTMALTPDGRLLATAGWTHEQCIGRCGDIRLFDFATGDLVATLQAHNNVVNGIAFSPDGKLLASGGFDTAVIIWDVASRKLLHRMQGHREVIYPVRFTLDGTRVLSGSYDTTVRMWSVRDGKEILPTLTGHKDKVHSLALSPVDGMIASGGVDGEIRLWDGKTGRFLRTLANQGGYVGALTFSRDGRRLLTTCGYTGCGHTQRVWEVATGKQLLEFKEHSNIVVSTTLGPDSDVVATGGFHGEAQIWNLKTGESQHKLAGKGATVWGVGFSPDGRRIAWGTRTRNGWVVNHYADMMHELRLPTDGSSLGRPEAVSPDAVSTFLRARSTHGNHTISHRQGGFHGFDAFLDIKQDNRLVASVERSSINGYAHRAYGFSTDGKTIISGGAGGVLTAYDLTGKSLGDFLGHEADVWAVTPSPDGRLLVSGGNDQTVRLWNLQTRELIATLFHSSDNEWVMWTPQGYYTGSPGSDKIVGWQINKGAESTADYVGADQLRTHLNRPDIVEKAIILASAEQAVRESAGTTFKLADLLARPVPKFRIVSPNSGSTQRGGRATIKIDVEAVRDPLKAMRVQVNGRQVAEITPDVGSGGLKAGEHGLDVPLAKGRNEVRITLNNEIGDKTETLTLNHEGDGDLDKRGTLYLLAIGVDRYPKLGNTCGEFNNQSCDLRYSGADARRLVDAAERRLGPAHTKVVKRVLVNGAGAGEAPTARNIIDAIDLLKDAQETDTILLFVAGHGVNDGPSYRFLATDAERAGTSFRGVTVVPWQVLQEAVEAAKGRRILFLDTCHSGNAYNQKLGNAAYHANIITYTSARFDQEALEDAQLGHGLFTYAVVEGLEGKGEFASKREISTQDLALFVVKRVDQLAKAMRRAQEPQYFKGRDAQDYVLVVQAR